MTAERNTVLIVEDTEPCAATLEIALSRITGVTVKIVSSAEQAQAEFEKGGVCVIVTDLQLPDASGFDLIAWIRARRNGCRIPIVVISGITDPDAPASSYHLGADAFFSKPFSPGEVRKKVEELIHA